MERLPRFIKRSEYMSLDWSSVQPGETISGIQVTEENVDAVRRLGTSWKIAVDFILEAQENEHLKSRYDKIGVILALLMIGLSFFVLRKFHL